MLAGVLTQEDEDAVLTELEAITQVGITQNPLLIPLLRSHAGQARGEFRFNGVLALQRRGNIQQCCYSDLIFTPA